MSSSTRFSAGIVPKILSDFSGQSRSWTRFASSICFITLWEHAECNLPTPKLVSPAIKLRLFFLWKQWSKILGRASLVKCLQHGPPKNTHRTPPRCQYIVAKYKQTLELAIASILLYTWSSSSLGLDSSHLRFSARASPRSRQLSARLSLPLRES